MRIGDRRLAQEGQRRGDEPRGDGAVVEEAAGLARLDDRVGLPERRGGGKAGGAEEGVGELHRGEFPRRRSAPRAVSSKRTCKSTTTAIEPTSPWFAASPQASNGQDMSMKKKPGACSLSGATPPPPLAIGAEFRRAVAHGRATALGLVLLRRAVHARALARMEELLRTLLQAVEKRPAALAQTNPAAAASAGGGGGDALGAKLARIEERLDALASLGVRAAPSLDERAASPAPSAARRPRSRSTSAATAARAPRRESGGGYGGPDSPSMFCFGGGDELLAVGAQPVRPRRRRRRLVHQRHVGAGPPRGRRGGGEGRRASTSATQRRRPPISPRTEDSRTRASRRSSSGRRRAADAPSGRPSRRKCHSKARARSPSTVKRRSSAAAPTPTTPPASRRRASAIRAHATPLGATGKSAVARTLENEEAAALSLRKAAAKERRSSTASSAVTQGERRSSTGGFIGGEAASWRRDGGDGGTPPPSCALPSPSLATPADRDPPRRRSEVDAKPWEPSWRRSRPAGASGGDGDGRYAAVAAESSSFEEEGLGERWEEEAAALKLGSQERRSGDEWWRQPRVRRPSVERKDSCLRASTTARRWSTLKCGVAGKVTAPLRRPRSPRHSSPAR